MQVAVAEDGTIYSVIHWEVDGRLVCTRAKAYPPFQRTDDPRAVTCALCREKYMQVALKPDGSTYAVIHWTVAGRLACASGNDLTGLQYSDDPRAANCALCRQTLAWHGAVREIKEGIQNKKAAI